MEELNEEEVLPSHYYCPITHGLMRDPCMAADGQVYDRLAITRWFAQRVTSPLTGETLASTVLIPQKNLRNEIAAVAKLRKHTEEGASYFACPFCGELKCDSRSACRSKYERQLRRDAAYGAAARRRRWIEGNVIPSAERALRSGPVGTGALMLGAFSIGAVGAIVGGVASSIAEVTSGGVEIARGVVDAASWASRTAFPSTDNTTTDADPSNNESKSEENEHEQALTERIEPTEEDVSDDQRPSWSRGCFKIASGAVLVPVASCSIAAMFAVGAACGTVTLAGGVLKEIGSSLVAAVRITANAIAGNHQDENNEQITTTDTQQNATNTI